MEQPLSFTNDLTKIGLSENEAIVYETLIYKGERSASMLKRALPTSISRPMLYFILDRLVEIGLVIKKEIKGKPASFAAEHPKKLENIILRKQEELEKTKAQFDIVIGGITSGYNLQIGKPYVEFFEGEKAFSEVLRDSLTSKETILQYVDVEATEKYSQATNEKYLKQRRSKGVEKKLLVIDNEFTCNVYRIEKEAGIDISNIRTLPQKNYPFGVSLMIYDGKISYITLSGENNAIGVIIHNEEIYRMNKYIFETIFDTAKNILH